MSIVAVDFDGTLAEHIFPAIGTEVPFAFQVLKELQEARHQLLLWTMRNDGRPDDTGPVLTWAVEWCRERKIEFWAVNENPEQESWTQSPKAYAHFYIDDAAVGCPLMDSTGTDRKMVDWKKVRKLLVKAGLLPKVKKGGW